MSDYKGVRSVDLEKNKGNSKYFDEHLIPDSNYARTN